MDKRFEERLFEVSDARAKKMLPCTPHYSRLLYEEFQLGIKAALRDEQDPAALVSAIGAVTLTQSAKIFVSVTATMVQFRCPDDTIAEFMRGLLDQFEKTVWEEMKEIERDARAKGFRL